MLDYHYDLYMKHLQKEYFDKIEFDLVVYDEIEDFRDPDEKNQNYTFMYPFSKRKSKLATFQINTDFFRYDPDIFRINFNHYDY